MKKIINFKSAAIMVFMAFSAMPLLAQPVTRGTGERQGQGQGQRQRQPMTEANVKERVGRISETLGCTDEQKQKMVDFEIAQFKKGQEKRQEYAGDRQAMMDYMKEVNKLRQEKYAEILSPEQMKKYNQYLEERRQQRQQRRPGQGSEEQPNRGRGRN